MQPQIQIPIVIIIADSNYYYFVQVHVYLKKKHFAHMPSLILALKVAYS